MTCPPTAAHLPQPDTTGPANPPPAPDDLGTYPWVERTGGRLTTAEKRQLSRPLAASHASNLTRVPQVDFTRASARAAQQVAEQVGLSTAATDTLRSAIALHHSPGVSLTHGPVAYLLSAGAAVDVVGLRSWQLPPALLVDVVTAYPRAGFKREFTAAFRAEAVRVPRGRAAYLRRYGAFDLAIRTAPFPG